MTRKKVVPIPKAITVAHRTIEVAMVSKLDGEIMGIHGCFGDNESLIKIREDLQPALTRETLLHEVLHAVYRIYGVQDEDEEERTVNVLSVGLQNVIEDNPKLMDYLRSK